MFAEGLYREIGTKILRRISNHQDLGVDYIHMLGSRGCGKTQFDIEFNVRACNVYDKEGKPVRVDSFATRFNQKDIDELWDDWNNKLEDLPELEIDDKQRKKTSKRWDFDNDNVLKFKGINSQTKNKTSNTGMATSRAEYIIANVEEAYEVPPRKMQDFMDAVRGRVDSRTLVINLCNPWDSRNDYIAWCLKNCPFDEQLMRSQGYCYRYLEEVDEEGYKTRHLIFWINWRQIKKYLSPQFISRILRRYVTDPTRAKTADLGCPGVIDIAVYGNFMQHIGSPVPWTQKDYYVGGGDLGTGGSVHSGKTSFIFAGGNENGGFIDVFRQFTWSNYEREAIDGHTLACKIVQFYIDCRKEFMERVKVDITRREPLEVRVDNSADIFIEALNDQARLVGADQWLYFTASTKYALIDRVYAKQYLMGAGRLRVDDQCGEFLKELALLQWDENAPADKPKTKGGDHSIDAFDYAFEKYMKSWVDSDEAYSHFKESGSYNKRKRLFI